MPVHRLVMDSLSYMMFHVLDCRDSVFTELDVNNTINLAEAIGILSDLYCNRVNARPVTDEYFVWMVHRLRRDLRPSPQDCGNEPAIRSHVYGIYSKRSPKECNNAPWFECSSRSMERAVSSVTGCEVEVMVGLEQALDDYIRSCQSTGWNHRHAQ